MRLSYILKAISLMMMYTGIFLFLPILIALVYHDKSSITPFITAAIFSAGLGYLIRKIYPQTAKLENLNDIKKSEALFIVASSWIVFAFLAAIPYLFYNFSFINALFEATSGITTTGATIFTNFDYPKALFFWRSLTQWLGGLGIIVLFVAILPQFAVAGRQMFFAEAPGPTEDKFTPRIRNTASTLWKLYLGLTILLAVLLIIVGMPVFDSVCNALSTLSAGGFSPNSQSIMGYHLPCATWLIFIFMFFAGASFNLQYKVIQKRNPLLLFKSEEFNLYFSVVMCASLMIATMLIVTHNYNIGDALRHSAFQVVSLMTSTGAASVDFTKWSYSAQILLFIVMFFGSCASSAGGGIKMTRWLLVFKTMKNEIVKILHPNAVLNVKIDNSVVPPEVIRQVVVFVFFYFMIYAITAITVTLIEQNHTLGLTSTITALGNIGPGFGTIGPMESFDFMHASTKLILIFNMIVGRLELIPFLVMCQKDFWSIKV